MLLVWGDYWAIYERGRVWCYSGRRVSTTVEGRSIWCYFGETCGYHSRLEGYGVCPGEACLCQLQTDNLLRVMIYNFVQKCIMLAKNNVMSVLAPI